MVYMVVILGSTGMLGSMLAETLDLDIKAINRPQLDAEEPFDFELDGDRIINCIGKIKPYCEDVEGAILVNALFPHTLPKESIQIATDCVYSGRKGNYVETDSHDALDVYGKTKSLGEAPHLNNLRCSIIGPEKKNHLSLLDWFLDQEVVNGFTNHLWNGITTLHFSRIVQGIIREGIELPTLQHIVPANVLTKAELLTCIAKEFDKNIPVIATEAMIPIDRTLHTINPDLNNKLWRAAGYPEPPTIQHMIKELAAL